MSDFWTAIKEVEDEIGGTIDSNFDPGVNGLCHGDTCHDECDCWDNLKAATKEHLEANKTCCEKCFKCRADITGTLLCDSCNDEMKSRLARATTNAADLPTKAPINYCADEGVVLLEDLYFGPSVGRHGVK